MGLLADIQKTVKAHHVIFAIGLIVAAVALSIQSWQGCRNGRYVQCQPCRSEGSREYADAAGYGGQHEAASLPTSMAVRPWLPPLFPVVPVPQVSQAALASQ